MITNIDTFVDKSYLNYLYLRYTNDLDTNKRNNPKYDYSIEVTHLNVNHEFLENAKADFVIANDQLYILNDIKYNSRLDDDEIYIIIRMPQTETEDEIQVKLEEYLYSLIPPIDTSTTSIDDIYEEDWNTRIFDEKCTSTGIPTPTKTVPLSKTIDKVNSIGTDPDYYKGNGKDDVTECWDYISQHDLCYFRGTAVKHITRAGKKENNSFELDIRKAIKYLEKCLVVNGVDGQREKSRNDLSR